MRKRKKSIRFLSFSILNLIFIILILSCCQYVIFYYVIEDGKEPTTMKSLDMKKLKIKTITFSHNVHDRFRLLIKFNQYEHEKNQPTLLFTSLISTFTFTSSEYTMIFNSSNGYYEHDFFLPIIDEYTVSIQFKHKNYLTFNHRIDSIHHIFENYSTMRCYGHDFADRYCELNRTCYSEKKFIFFTNITTKFRTNIVYPGSRPIPRDYPSCRNAVRLISRNEEFSSYEKLNSFSDRSFLTCRWYGMQHLWHTLFDYTLPIWWAMNEFGGHNESDRIFLIDENTNTKKGFLFKSMLTSREVINIRLNESYFNKTCFDHLILGVPKTELNVDPSKWTNGLFLPYEYKAEAFDGFREQAIRTYIPGTKQCGFTQKKRILFINRATPKRFVINGDELVRAMREWAPRCDIEYTLMENTSIPHQIETVCNASMLISIHGSALSHMVWMRNINTAVVEIFPYRYDCRDWYQQIAESYHINYFSWINKNISNTFQGRSGPYKKCLKQENACSSDQCHECLRDQPTIVDLFSFKKVFMSALKSIE